MKWILKRLPPLLGIFFISITIVRVSSFASDDSVTWRILSILFAIGLAISVFACSFFLTYKDTRKAAWIGLVFFTAIDGYFNLIETLVWSVDQGRWVQMIEIGGRNFYTYRLADFVYGLFPTGAAVILGALTRYTMLIQDSKPKGLWREFQDMLSEIIAGSEDKPGPQVEEGVIEPKSDVDSLPNWMSERPKNKKQFLTLIKEGKITIPESLKGAELAKYIPVSARSAQDWLRAGRELAYERNIKSQMESGSEPSGNGNKQGETEFLGEIQEQPEHDPSAPGGTRDVSRYRRA